MNNGRFSLQSKFRKGLFYTKSIIAKKGHKKGKISNFGGEIL